VDLYLSRALQGEAKEDDAGVGMALTKHQLTKVFIVGDEDPSLALGEGEHVLVGNAWGIVVADTGTP